MNWHSTCEDRHLQAPTLPTTLKPILRAILDLSAQDQATAGTNRRESLERSPPLRVKNPTSTEDAVRLNLAIGWAAMVILPRGPDDDLLAVWSTASAGRRVLSGVWSLCAPAECAGQPAGRHDTRCGPNAVGIHRRRRGRTATEFERRGV